MTFHTLSLPSAVLALSLVLPLRASAAKFYTYVGAIGTESVVLAWGTTDGGNTIGRTSRSHGKAKVRIGTQQVEVADQNWASVEGLQPDTEYEYEVTLNGTRVGAGKVRTWPVKADRLRFFVIGDFGSGDSHQRAVAQSMWKEFQKHEGTSNPVRFIATTGDNLYGAIGLTLRFRNTGAEDRDWEEKFYAPYEPVIGRIPFYASLGNHDGNETESRADLTTYLDNFFFPSPQPARYYRFSYGGMADFFALDSTTNSETGSPRPAYLRSGDQHKWLEKNLAESQVPWKIPFLHHPPYNAGPRHPSAKNELAHFLELFRKHGVRVVFSGHEHNFQYTRANNETGNIRYVISGAGGELREGDVRSEMDRAQTEGWAPQLHFLSVEIEGSEMRVLPVGPETIRVRDRSGREIAMPLRIPARD
ncbi:MAG TPA: metallophosphoesterase [Bryobacteraceae bacterium]|nr:metallophosphoesterase [Bryobacteraceae bacterium]